MTRSPRSALLVLCLAAGGLAGCKAHISGLSINDRFQTGQVCLDVAGSVRTAAQVGLKLASGSVSQTDATTQLQPVVQHINDLATKNASLPIAASLKALADSIAKVQTVNPTTPSELQAAGSQLTTATKAVLSSCAAVGH